MTGVWWWAAWAAVGLVMVVTAGVSGLARRGVWWRWTAVAVFVGAVAAVALQGPAGRYSEVVHFDLGLGRAAPPEGVFVDLSAGLFRTCGVRAGGGIECWGEEFGQVPVGRFVAVDIVDGVLWESWQGGEPGRAGRGCAVGVDALVVCWSGHAGYFGGSGSGLREDTYYRHGQNLAPQGEFVDVSVSMTVSCGLRGDGSVLCWGDRSHGDLDAPEGPFVEVFAGDPSRLLPSCGLRVGGGYVCWGQSTAPHPPQGEFVDLSSTDAGGCAVSVGGSVECWGRWSDPPAGSDFVEAVVYPDRACAARASGAVVCWNAAPEYDNGLSTQILDVRLYASREAWSASREAPEGSLGSMGLGGDFSALQPTPAGRFAKVSAGVLTSCGLRPDGTVACWGSQGVESPQGRFVDVSGGSRPCAIRVGGAIECWGHHSGGLPPSSIGQPVVSAARGAHTTCGILADATMACWHQWAQVPVDAPVGEFLQVDRTSGPPCALRVDRTIVCWNPDGDPLWDVLSDPPPGEFTDIAVGAHHACAIRVDGTVACWGDNSDRLHMPSGCESCPSLP